MPANEISPEEAQAIRAYVIAKSHQLKAEQAQEP